MSRGQMQQHKNHGKNQVQCALFLLYRPHREPVSAANSTSRHLNQRGVFARRPSTQRRSRRRPASRRMLSKVWASTLNPSASFAAPAAPHRARSRSEWTAKRPVAARAAGGHPPPPPRSPCSPTPLWPAFRGSTGSTLQVCRTGDTFCVHSQSICLSSRA